MAANESESRMPHQISSLIFAASLFAAMTVGCAKPDAKPAVSPKLTSRVEPDQAPTPSDSDEGETAAAPTSDVSDPSPQSPDEPPLELAQAAPPPTARPADISFDDLKLDIEPSSRFDDSMLTEQIKRLDGQPIRIRGVMYPTFSKKGNESFILLMNKECKFGSTKDPVWCNIRVVMDEGHTADYTYDPITVEGVLSLDVMKGPKYDLSVYMLTGAKLK